MALGCDSFGDIRALHKRDMSEENEYLVRSSRSDLEINLQFPRGLKKACLQRNFQGET